MALQKIDNLFALSEKARKLDKIVGSDADRGVVKIDAVIEEVVAGVRREFPSASISVTGERQTETAVLPSFEHAIRELIENAAKHGSENPAVEVTIESVPNGIEIRIADDGPGLDNQELGVLHSGAETPLLHGSGLGLWLAHWVVSSHDGTITANVTEKGTELTITVPRTSLSGENQRVEGLVRAQDQYKAAFNEAGDGMTITDDEARILDVNTEAARLYGEDRQELIGRSMREFLPDDFDFEDEWGEIQAAKIKRDEMNIISADGGVNPIEYTAKTDIVPGQHLIVSRDISERKEHEREMYLSKERYQSLFNVLPSPVVVTDIETGEIIEINDALISFLETSRENLIGERLISFLPSDDEELYQELFESTTEDPTTITQLPDGSLPKLTSTTGESVPVEVNIGTCDLGDRDVNVAIFQDVSDKNAGFQSLLNRVEQLEAFSSVVSHDLRNPLNVAQSRVELAKRDCDSEHLEDIHTAHARMEELIADLLVLAKQGEAVSNPEPVGLLDLVNGCWENVDTDAATLVTDVHRSIRADASRIQQLFENLFRNAIDHGGEEVTVTVGNLANGFYVEDDGPGIPEPEREAIFEAGYSTHDEGSGFGLNIAREVADAHDWVLDVTEGSDGGARFEVTEVEFIAV